MKSTIRKTLDVFFLLCYFAVLINTSRYLAEVSLEVSYANILPFPFIVAVWLFYSAVYLLPAYALSHILCFFVVRKTDSPELTKSKIKVWTVYSFAVVFATLVQLFLITDYTVYMAFKFHCNSFVLNLLTTPGGIESMDINSESQFLFALKIGMVFLKQRAAIL